MNTGSAGAGAEMVLRDRLSDDVMSVPVSLAGDEFEVRVDLDPLSGLHRPDKQVWDLWLYRRCVRRVASVPTDSVSGFSETRKEGV